MTIRVLVHASSSPNVVKMLLCIIIIASTRHEHETTLWVEAPHLFLHLDHYGVLINAAAVGGLVPSLPALQDMIHLFRKSYFEILNSGAWRPRCSTAPFDAVRGRWRRGGRVAVAVAQVVGGIGVGVAIGVTIVVVGGALLVWRVVRRVVGATAIVGIVVVALHMLVVARP